MGSPNDAFGHALYDFMKGEIVRDIIERDDGFITVPTGPEIYFADYESWQPADQLALKYAFGKVLDIGCGAGRHALYLQNEGLSVVGIDSSPLAVYVSKRRGVRYARLCSITEVSSKLGRFDTILMLGNNFGLMANQTRARWLLRRFYSMTPSTGRIIAASSDPYQTDDPDHLAYMAKNKARARMSGQLRIRYRYRNYKDDWFDYLFVSIEEMEKLLAETGWRVERCIESEPPLYIAIIDKAI